MSNETREIEQPPEGWVACAYTAVAELKKQGGKVSSELLKGSYLAANMNALVMAKNGPLHLALQELSPDLVFKAYP